MNDLELENKKIIYNYNNITFEIGGTKNEKLDINSTLIISNNECELKLKNYYNISLNEQLYFFKIIIPEQGKRISKLKYEYFYHLKDGNNTLIELDISICENEKVKIYNKINITGDLDKYDINSEYYNSICYSVENEKYDLILKDRRNIYDNNNLSVCQDNCFFLDYDYEYQAALCSCQIKLVNNNIEVGFSGEKLIQKAKDIYKYMNLNVITCIKKLFSINGIKVNIGFYVFMILIIICCILIFLFWKKEYLDFISIIDKIKSDKKDSTELDERNKQKRNINKKKQKQDKTLSLNKKTKKNIHKRSGVEKLDTKINNTQIKGSISNYSILKYTTMKNILINTQDIDLKKILEMNETEYNKLTYEDALQLDKRNYLQYYYSLIVVNHPVIFTFFYDNDYNPKYIKKYLFFYNFGVYFFVNTLFFTDSTMHKIYLDEGSYNLVYQIPQIIYSNIISAFLNTFLRMLALPESTIIKFKQKKNLSNSKEEIKSIKNSLKKRFVVLFTISLLLLIFFWLYISCFCVVYKKTQIHLFKDILISFSSSFFTPFAVYILPSLIRIPSLKNEKKNKKCLYGLSKLLQSI